MNKEKEKEKEVQIKTKSDKNDKKLDSSFNSVTDLSERKIIVDLGKNGLSALNKVIKKKEHYYHKGKVHMFFFDKDGMPRIVIGPHCKKKIYFKFENREIHNLFASYNGRNNCTIL